MASSERPAAQPQDAAVTEHRKAKCREKVALCFLQLYATLNTSTLRTPKAAWSWGAGGQAGGNAKIVQRRARVKEKGQEGALFSAEATLKGVALGVRSGAQGKGER